MVNVGHICPEVCTCEEPSFGTMLLLILWVSYGHRCGDKCVAWRKVLTNIGAGVWSVARKHTHTHTHTHTNNRIIIWLGAIAYFIKAILVKFANQDLEHPISITSYVLKPQYSLVDSAFMTLVIWMPLNLALKQMCHMCFTCVLHT